MRGLKDTHRLWIDVITIVALGVAIWFGAASQSEPSGAAVHAAARPRR